MFEGSHHEALKLLSLLCTSLQGLPAFCFPLLGWVYSIEPPYHKSRKKFNGEINLNTGAVSSCALQGILK